MISPETISKLREAVRNYDKDREDLVMVGKIADLLADHMPLLLDEIERLNEVVKELEPAYLLQEIKSGRATMSCCGKNISSCSCRDSQVKRVE